jgi:hypothetical protein
MRIYNIPGSNDSQMEGCCIPEGRERNAENKFIEATAELVCEILQIGYKIKEFANHF